DRPDHGDGVSAEGAASTQVRDRRTDVGELPGAAPASAPPPGTACAGRGGAVGGRLAANAHRCEPVTGARPAGQVAAAVLPYRGCQHVPHLIAGHGMGISVLIVDDHEDFRSFALVAGLAVAAAATGGLLAGRHPQAHAVTELHVACGLSFLLVGSLAQSRRPHSRTGSLMTVVALLWFAGD